MYIMTQINNNKIGLLKALKLKGGRRRSFRRNRQGYDNIRLKLLKEGAQPRRPKPKSRN